MRRAFSTSIFARHDGHILLVFHHRLQQWLPVGGELNAGETPLEGAMRELREETGLAGDFRGSGPVEGSPPGLLAYEEHPAGSKGLHLNFCFVADVPTREVTANHEFSRHQWVSTAPREACPANVQRLVQMARSHGEGLASRWIAAFNGRDVAALLTLYDEAAEHITPKLRARNPASGGRLRGKPALRVAASRGP